MEATTSLFSMMSLKLVSGCPVIPSCPDRIRRAGAPIALPNSSEFISFLVRFSPLKVDPALPFSRKIWVAGLNSLDSSLKHEEVPKKAGVKSHFSPSSKVQEDWKPSYWALGLWSARTGFVKRLENGFHSL